MIVFVVAAENARSHMALAGAEAGLQVKLVHYAAIRGAKSVPRATYIFTDIDRLSTQTLRMAAQRCKQLRAAGAKVLNDPARMLSRSGLLRALFRKGINRFNCYRAEEQIAPTRWPVFLRTEGDHEAPGETLYHGADELWRGIDKALESGIPMSKLLIVEFMAEPVKPGLYRKLSCFRVGERSVAHTCVHDTHWIAKAGKMGVATPDLYDDELRIVRDDPFGAQLAEAFAIGGVEYGRADFGLVDGVPQIYEINPGPMMEFPDSHPSPARVEAYGIFRRNYFAALKAIDTPA